VILYYLEEKPGLDLRLERSSDGASGYDVQAAIDMPREIAPGGRWLGSTGLYLAMPKGVEAQVRSRSGMALHHGIFVLNAPGTIDSDYRGECRVLLQNADRERPYVVHPGDRIAQIVFAPTMQLFATRGYRDSVMAPHFWEPYRVESKDKLGITDRGASGHGSTGR